MHLVSSALESAASTPSLAGLPLCVVFADGDAITAAREGAESILLVPPFHVSDDDVYLVLPEDIGAEIVDIARDGDLELLAEAMRDGLIVTGTIEREGRGKVFLQVESHAAPDSARKKLAYATTLRAGTGDPLAQLNALPQVQVTMCNAFVDEEGLGAMLGAREFLGASWRVPEEDKARLAGVEPTYVWTQRGPDGRLTIELALFQEYDEIVAVLRPVQITR